MLGTQLEELKEWTAGGTGELGVKKEKKRGEKLVVPLVGSLFLSRNTLLYVHNAV
jgi:hypothetical protein